MDKKIQKLELLFLKYIYKTPEQIRQKLGKPLKSSNEEMLFYFRYRYLIFRDEISFIIHDDKVVDILLTESILGIRFWEIFYNELEDCYNVIRLREF